MVLQSATSCFVSGYPRAGGFAEDKVKEPAALSARFSVVSLRVCVVFNGKTLLQTHTLMQHALPLSREE